MNCCSSGDTTNSRSDCTITKNINNENDNTQDIKISKNNNNENNALDIANKQESKPPQSCRLEHEDNKDNSNKISPFKRTKTRHYK